jgi:hypothetical protein
MWRKGKSGNPEGVNQFSGVELEDRFRRQFVILSNGCWQWIGSFTPAGYGKIVIEKRTIGAHKISYLWHVGDIPEGDLVHHSCENKGCVNPAHLELKTPLTHARFHLHKSFCKRGHAMTEENMMIYRGHRRCKLCTNELQKARYHQRKAAA